MIEKLPREIQVMVLSECSFKTLVVLRQTCWLYKELAEEQLYATSELDVSSDYFGMYDLFSDELFNDVCTLSPQKLVDFLAGYIPELRKLSLRSAPIVLQLADLIQIAKAVPLLEHLDLSQTDSKPCFGKNATMALPYFSNLKSLKMDGFSIRKSTGRGCSYRLEIPPINQLRLLENFEIMEDSHVNCPADILFGILYSLRESNTVLRNLQSINFAVRHSPRPFPELLIWFLRNHKTLRCVRLHNILFETSQQLRTFYNALIMLPLLREVQLERCDQVGQTDTDTQVYFSKAIQAKGIRSRGAVRSMYHDPDREH